MVVTWYQITACVQMFLLIQLFFALCCESHLLLLAHCYYSTLSQHLKEIILNCSNSFFVIINCKTLAGKLPVHAYTALHSVLNFANCKLSILKKLRVGAFFCIKITQPCKSRVFEMSKGRVNSI